MISYLSFNVATRGWVEKNGETIEKFLAAVSEAAMQFNIQQADRRLSANNYRALWAAQDRLNRLGILKSTFDVNRHIEPKHMLKVMRDKPELFSDLPAIPADVAIGPGFQFKP